MGAVYQQFYWDPDALVYRYPNGSVVSTGKVKAALDQALNKTAKQAYDLSVKLKEGQISIAAWQTGMKAFIKDSQIYSAGMALGGIGNLKGSDYGMLGPLSKTQYQYLQKFAKGIESGKIKLDGIFLRRAELYPQAGWQTFTLFDKKVHVEKGYDQERNVLDPAAEHCSTCKECSAAGWVEIGTLLPIGSRKCKMRDRCHLIYRVSPAKKKAMAQAEAAAKAAAPEVVPPPVNLGIPDAVPPPVTLVDEAAKIVEAKNAIKVLDDAVDVALAPLAGLQDAVKVVDLVEDAAPHIVDTASLMKTIGQKSESLSKLYPLKGTPPPMPVGFSVVGEAVTEVKVFGKIRQVPAYMVEVPDGTVAWVNKGGQGITTGQINKLKKHGYAKLDLKKVKAAEASAIADAAAGIPTPPPSQFPNFPEAPQMPAGFEVYEKVPLGYKVKTPMGFEVTVDKFGKPVTQVGNSQLLASGYYENKLPPIGGKPELPPGFKLEEQDALGNWSVETPKGKIAFIKPDGTPGGPASTKTLNAEGYFGPPSATLPKIPPGMKIVGSYEVPVVEAVGPGGGTVGTMKTIYKLELPDGNHAFINTNGSAYNSYSSSLLAKHASAPTSTVPPSIATKAPMTSSAAKTATQTAAKRAKKSKKVKVGAKRPRGEDEVFDRYRDALAGFTEDQWEPLRKGVTNPTGRNIDGYDQANRALTSIKNKEFRETFRRRFPNMTDAEFDEVLRKYYTHVTAWRGSSNAALSGHLKESAERITKGEASMTFHGKYVDHDAAKKADAVKNAFDKEWSGSSSRGNVLSKDILDAITEEERRFSSAFLETMFGGQGTIKLYRGVRYSYFRDIGIDPPGYGEVREGVVAMNAIASWSTRRALAKGFGEYVFEIDVPFDQITFNGWSSYLIQTEWEMVVLGKPTKYTLKGS